MLNVRLHQFARGAYLIAMEFVPLRAEMMRVYEDAETLCTGFMSVWVYWPMHILKDV